MPRLRATVALRLTLWYVAAFSVSSVLALGLVYFAVQRGLHADADAELRQDLQEAVAIVDRGGIEAFRQELARDLAAPDSARVFLRIWSAEGTPLASAGFPAADAATRSLVAEQREREEPMLRTLRVDGSEHAVRVALGKSEAGVVVELGASLEDVDRSLGALRTGILIALPAFLLLGGPLGWFMARRALRGVGVVTGTALEIAAGAMDRRVPVGSRGDELDRLAQAFNTMLDRIELLIAGMREVTDNLAHDLRSPLARIRASAERAAARAATPDEWAAFAETTTEECDRMLDILNGSLEIAEAEAGAMRLRLEELDLAVLAEQAREVFATVAEDAGVTLECAASGPCPVHADRGRVQRIVANLLDNALRHTPAGGRVTLAAVAGDAGARLEVRDTGVGIAATDLPRVFERFYRAGGSRTGRGAGLGLSLARAFARAHGGDLTAVSAPGKGSVFTLRLSRGAGEPRVHSVRNSPDESV